MYRPNTTGSKGDGGVNAQFYIITDMENGTFYGHFREKSARKSCVNFIFSFWNPLYYITHKYSINTLAHREVYELHLCMYYM